MSRTPDKSPERTNDRIAATASRRGVKLAVAVIAVAAVAVLVVRSQLRHTSPDQTDGNLEPAARGERVRERLRQLHESRDQIGDVEANTAPGEQRQARSGIVPTPMATRARNGSDARGARGPGVGGGAAAPPEKHPVDVDLTNIPELKKLATEDPDPERRLAAVTLLGASDNPDAVPVLAQALLDNDEEVRMAAVQSLADFTGEAPIKALQPALKDPSADVRYEALEVISDFGGEQARRAVQAALNDPDEDVRWLAESLADEPLEPEEPAD